MSKPTTKPAGKPPAFQVYPKDALSDARCQAMTNQQFGIYWKLLFFLWLDLGPGLPNDPDALARMVHEPPKVFQKLWPAIRLCFYVREDGRLSQKHLEEVRQDQIDRQEQQSAAGKAGAAARWPKDDSATDSPQRPLSDRTSGGIATPMAKNGSPSASASASASPSPSSPPTPAPAASAAGGTESPPPGVRRGVWARICGDCEHLGVPPRPEYADVDLTVRSDLIRRKDDGDPEVTPAYVEARFAANLVSHGRSAEAIAQAARTGGPAEEDDDAT